jgi:hypothetical protein
VEGSREFLQAVGFQSIMLDVEGQGKLIQMQNLCILLSVWPSMFLQRHTKGQRFSAGVSREVLNECLSIFI